LLDLEIARLWGGHRIPFRFASKGSAPDYLAFYQPGNFCEASGWTIWITAGCGHELTTGAHLLKDEPDLARTGEEYYMIQSGSLERLSSPVLAQSWKWNSILYSTRESQLKVKAT
jgi:hypothetical protein